MNKLSSSINAFPPSNENEYRHQFNELVESGPMNGFVVKNGTLVKASVMDTMLKKAKGIFGGDQGNQAVTDKFLEFIKVGKEHKWLNYQDVDMITQLASRVFWPDEVENADLFQIIGEIAQESPKEELMSEMREIIETNDVEKFRQIANRYPQKAKRMLELQDEEGRTPLHEAAIHDRRELIELMAILEPEVFKSNTLKMDNRGLTPVHQEKIGLSKLLLKHAPDEFNEVLLVQDVSGNTPLHLMADQEVKELATYVKTLRELSNYPTAMKMVNDNGYNFLSLIRVNRH
jgi:hypothetical protein